MSMAALLPRQLAVVDEDEEGSAGEGGVGNQGAKNDNRSMDHLLLFPVSSFVACLLD